MPKGRPSISHLRQNKINARQRFFAPLLFLFCALSYNAGIAFAAEAVTHWRPAGGMTLTREAGQTIKLTGTQAGSWVYATAPLPVAKLEPGAVYRLEGWMKVESLSDAGVHPAIKLVVNDRHGRYVGDYPTFCYSLAKLKTWQKVWVEIMADDQFDGGHLAVDKGATSKNMSAVLFVKDVMFKKIIKTMKAANTKALSADDVYWPYKKSDVIGWVPGTLKDYEDYGVTFVSWGRHPSREAHAAKTYCGIIADAARFGTHIGADIGFKTSFGDFIRHSPEETLHNARILDLRGQPILVEEMSDVRVEGKPAYWFSIHNPDYREYLKDLAQRALQCSPYGLLIDDVMGSTGPALWADGDYSVDSIHGFRRYLQSNFTPVQLSQNGIPDIETFDIGMLHRNYVSAHRNKRPLRKEFIDFHASSAADFASEIRDESLAKLARRIPIGANLSPAFRYADHLVSSLDYFSFECSMKAGEVRPGDGEALLAYKMAAAMKRPAVAMGTGRDHAYVEKNHLPGLVRYWIAEAYANGSYFMAPYRLWAYSPSRGSHNYRPRSSMELAPLMRFIKTQAHLFDSQVAVAKVALLLSYPSHVEGRTDFGATVKQLADMNIPFDIVIAGDNHLGLSLSEKCLDAYHSVLKPAGAILSMEEQGILDKFRSAGGRVVEDANALDPVLKIEIRKASNVRATLRAGNERAKGKGVIHLLNSDYVMATDSYRPKKEFTVIVPRTLLTGCDIKQISLIRPPSWPGLTGKPHDQENVPLEFDVSDTSVSIFVPGLDIWGILEIL
jgi:hypothetical protein